MKILRRDNYLGLLKNYNILEDTQQSITLNGHSSGIVKADRRVLLPSRLERSAPIIIDDMESISNWSAFSSSTRALNATQHVSGTNSIKVTSTSGGTGDIRRAFATPQDFSSAKQIVFYAYIHDSVNLSTSSSISIRLFTANYTAYYQFTLPYATYMANRWMRIICPKSKMTTSGSPTGWNAITGIQLRFVSNTGQVGNVSFDEISMITDPIPAVMLRFDDGPVVQYSTLFPIMKRHNIVGTLYIPYQYPGQANYCTWDELLEMQACGWVIGNHGDHRDLTQLTQGQVETILTTADQTLASHGLNGGKYLSFPSGERNDTVLAAMANTGMLIGHDNYGPTGVVGCPPLDWYNIGSYPTANTTTLSTLTGYIDDAITDGTVFCTHIHNVGSESDLTLEVFNGLIDYIVSKKMYVLTIDDLYKLNTGSVRVRRAT